MRGSAESIDAAKVTLLLRSLGAPLATAYLASNAILYGKSVNVRLAEGTDLSSAQVKLRGLGAMVD
jgi:hypothetical protein